MKDGAVCGWLLKSGEHLTWNVKRRWVVLDHSALTWSVNPSDLHYSGSLPLSAISTSRLSTTLKRHSSFEVVNRGPVAIYFIAESPADAQRWVIAIEAARVASASTRRTSSKQLGTFQLMSLESSAGPSPIPTSTSAALRMQRECGSSDWNSSTDEAPNNISYANSYDSLNIFDGFAATPPSPPEMITQGQIPTSEGPMLWVPQAVLATPPVELCCHVGLDPPASYDLPFWPHAHVSAYCSPALSRRGEQQRRHATSEWNEVSPWRIPVPRRS